MFTLLPLLSVPAKKIFSFVGALFYNTVAYFLFIADTVLHECNWVIFLCMDVSLSDVSGWGREAES